MKIDGKPLKLDLPAPANVPGVKPGQPGASRSAKETQHDSAAVSGQARFVHGLLMAVNRLPDIRQDAVERAREKLALGEVGNDASRLADRLIDHLLR